MPQSNLPPSSSSTTITIKMTFDKTYSFYKETRDGNPEQPVESTRVHHGLSDVLLRGAIKSFLPQPRTPGYHYFNIVLVDSPECVGHSLNRFEPIDTIINNILIPLNPNPNYKLMVVTNREALWQIEYPPYVKLSKVFAYIKPEKPEETNMDQLQNHATMINKRHLMFAELLTTLKAPFVLLSEKGNDLQKRGCVTAFMAIYKLKLALKDEILTLKHSNLSQSAYEKFVTRARDAINIAKPALESHRGISEILSNFTVIIASLGALYVSLPLGAACLLVGAGKYLYTGHLFSPQTQSGALLHHLEKALPLATPAA